MDFGLTGPAGACSERHTELCGLIKSLSAFKTTAWQLVFLFACTTLAPVLWLADRMAACADYLNFLVSGRRTKLCGLTTGVSAVETIVWRLVRLFTCTLLPPALWLADRMPACAD